LGPAFGSEALWLKTVAVAVPLLRKREDPELWSVSYHLFEQTLERSAMKPNALLRMAKPPRLKSSSIKSMLKPRLE
jgi:hypothetical protein